jgi:hypothetical protein
VNAQGDDPQHRCQPVSLAPSLTAVHPHVHGGRADRAEDRRDDQAACKREGLAIA